MPMTDYQLANSVAYALRTITVTDPSNPTEGANFNAAEHKVAHSGLMGSILARGEMRDEKSPDAQLELGQKTIAAQKGVCTHLAAAVAHRLIKLGMAGSKIEIMTTNKGHGYGHTFVAINRAGDPANIDSWGDECILVDIWWANQNFSSDSLPVGEAPANFGQGAFLLRDNGHFKSYLANFGKAMGVVTKFN